MKRRYYLDTDSLYIELNAKASDDTREIADGLVIAIDRASRKLDLPTLETVALPTLTAQIA